VSVVCVCFVAISSLVFRIIKEIPVLVGSGTLYILNYITNAPICFTASAPFSGQFDIAFSKV